MVTPITAPMTQLFKSVGDFLASEKARVSDFVTVNDEDSTPMTADEATSKTRQIAMLMGEVAQLKEELAQMQDSHDSVYSEYSRLRSVSQGDNARLNRQIQDMYKSINTHILEKKDALTQAQQLAEQVRKLTTVGLDSLLHTVMLKGTLKEVLDAYDELQVDYEQLEMKYRDMYDSLADAPGFALLTLRMAGLGSLVDQFDMYPTAAEELAESRKANAVLDDEDNDIFSMTMSNQLEIDDLEAAIEKAVN